MPHKKHLQMCNLLSIPNWAVQMNLKLSNTDYSLENPFSLLLCHSKMRHINMSTEQTTDTKSQFNIQNTKVGIK